MVDILSWMKILNWKGLKDYEPICVSAFADVESRPCWLELFKGSQRGIEIVFRVPPPSCSTFGEINSQLRHGWQISFFKNVKIFNQRWHVHSWHVWARWRSQEFFSIMLDLRFWRKPSVEFDEVLYGTFYLTEWLVD